jgi:hypothetical protein
LNSRPLPENVERQLRILFPEKSAVPDPEDLRPLYKNAMASHKTHYIIIDAIDECAPAERTEVLQVLQELLALPSMVVKVFVVSRDGMRKEVEGIFKSYYHQSTNCREVAIDIATFIEDEVQDKINKPTIVKDPQVVSNIQEALTNGASGM